MIPYFNIFGINIGSYKIFLFFGLVVSTLLLRHNFKLIDGESNKGYDYIIISFISIVFGLIGSLIFRTIEINILEIFTPRIFSYGKNFFGGLIFGFFGIILYSFLREKSLLDILFVCTPSLLIGYSIGRIGCLLSGDGCYGIETDFFLGMSFPNGLVPTTKKVHPTPLYESFIVFSLFVYIQLKLKRIVSERKKLDLILIAFCGLALERFFIEFIRINRTYYGLTQAQWISILLLLIVFFVFIYYRFIKK